MGITAAPSPWYRVRSWQPAVLHSVPKRGVSPGDWQPTELFSKLSKDMASSHHFPSTVGSEKQEIKKNNTLYNMLEDKF